MRAIRAAGLTFAGIYHSHPRGANEPSARDVRQAFYPEAAYFLVSPQDRLSSMDKQPAVRAFSILSGKVEELLLEIL
jgi:proteasome lid subunit RPN8/RPN11